MYKEAMEDGIRSTRLGRNTTYYPKCCICGEEMPSMNYLRNVKYTCKKCKLENYLSDKEKKTDRDNEDKGKKFDNAVKRFEKTKGYSIKQYQKAIDTVYNNLFKEGWFDSTEEIMVAIELVKNNIKIRHHVKFGRYTVDFVLPDEKIILEVDGVIYHTDKTKEKTRDDLIVLSLGPEWEVIRITDKNINKNIRKLIPAIEKVKEKRRIYREEYNGYLPKWYNDIDR